MEDVPRRSPASSPPYADLLDLQGGTVVVRFTAEETLVIAPSRTIRRPAGGRLLLQLRRLHLASVPGAYAPVHAELWVDRACDPPILVRVDGVALEIDDAALRTEDGCTL